MRLILALLTLLGAPLAMTACAPPPTPEQIAAADCAARAGEMQRVGMMQSLQCVVPYADANKPCRTGADCLGDCRTAGSVAVPMGRETAGVCQANSDGFGCFTRVENGKAEPTLCVD